MRYYPGLMSYVVQFPGSKPPDDMCQGACQHPQRTEPLRAPAIIRREAHVGKFWYMRNTGDHMSGESSDCALCFAGRRLVKRPTYHTRCLQCPACKLSRLVCMKAASILQRWQIALLAVTSMYHLTRKFSGLMKPHEPWTWHTARSMRLFYNISTLDQNSAFVYRKNVRAAESIGIRASAPCVADAPTSKRSN